MGLFNAGTLKLFNAGNPQPDVTVCSFAESKKNEIVCTLLSIKRLETVSIFISGFFPFFMIIGIRLNNRVLSFLLTFDKQNSSVYSTLGEFLIPERTPVGKALSLFSKGQTPGHRTPFLIRNMSTSTSSLSVTEEIVAESEIQHIPLLDSVSDLHEGVTVEMKESMDSNMFGLRLRASLSYWKQQGKRGVWIKLPIEFSNLVDTAVREGFRYHHAEPDYLMLVKWIAETADALPVNASHRVGVGGFVMNDKKEVLVVQESNGSFKGKNVWKLPTGVVNEGEDICTAAIREVKEETRVDTEFVEILAFRQSHQSFFRKSDLFFVCVLRPLSFEIQKQASEIEAAQWMRIEDYAAQPFNQKNEIFKYIAEICLTKSEKDYTGFSTMSTTTISGKRSYLYFNNMDFEPSANHQ